MYDREKNHSATEKKKIKPKFAKKTVENMDIAQTKKELKSQFDRKKNNWKSFVQLNKLLKTKFARKPVENHNLTEKEQLKIKICKNNS